MKCLVGLLQRHFAARGQFAKGRVQPQLFIQVVGRPRRQVSNQWSDEFVQTKGS